MYALKLIAQIISTKFNENHKNTENQRKLQKSKNKKKIITM
jgi:hypothetical protein